VKTLVVAQRTLGVLILLAGSRLSMDGFARIEPTWIIWGGCALFVGFLLLLDTLVRER
jgi:hypothetical protein